jgi:TonB family protein
MILTVAVAAVMVPALVYTAMHPQTVTSTVKQIAYHMPAQIKNFHVAVVAARPTPTPRPSATPAPTPTPNPKASKAPTKTELAHLAHLKHAHALALAALRAKKLALSGQLSDSSGSASLDTTADTTASTSTGSQSEQAQTTSAGNSGTANNGAAGGISTASGAATPAAIAAAPQQQPQADATPVYEPDVVVDARFKQRVEPDYPDVAKEENAQGTAVVLATVGPTGKVLSVHIDQSTGNKLLDAAALSAARESLFVAPEVNGKPATETYRMVYTFSLSG